AARVGVISEPREVERAFIEEARDLVAAALRLRLCSGAEIFKEAKSEHTKRLIVLDLDLPLNTRPADQNLFRCPVGPKRRERRRRQQYARHEGNKQEITSHGNSFLSEIQPPTRVSSLQTQTLDDHT